MATVGSRGGSGLLGATSFRLALGYLLALLLVASVVVAALFWQLGDLLTAQLRQTVASEVRGLREQYRVGGVTLLADVISGRSVPQGDGRYLLLDATGAVIAGNLTAPPDGLEIGGGGATFTYRREADAARRLAFGVALEVPSGLVLVVARDIEEQRLLIDRLRLLLLAGFATIMLVGMAAAYLIARHILGRIDAMALTGRRIMAGRLSDRLPLQGTGDELDRLAESLNVMLERIEQLLQAMQEVSDNIAHDLRTPLTRIRNAVEEALREDRGSAAYRAALEDTLGEADELIRTFNALLSIARIEAAASDDRRQPIDVAQVAREVAELYEPAFEEARIALGVDADTGVEVAADRQLVSQAIANLLDNAIKYAALAENDAPHHEQAPIQVDLSVRRRGEHAEIVVSDNGPGIAAADRERALKRFVRLEASRTRPGTGLGLSLVAAVARMHGGCITLEDNRPGLRAVLSLPSVSAPGPSTAPEARPKLLGEVG